MVRKLAILAAGLSAASVAHADPISVGQWHTFGFDGTVGSALYSCGNCTNGVNPPSTQIPAAPWTFTLGASGGTLVVTDAFLAGDQFEMFDFGSTLGLTSVPGGGGCGNDITACLANPNVSKGSFLLGAGSHSITGILAASFSAGAGYLIVNEAVAPGVPEPATWALMIGGFALAGAAIRRRAVVVSFG